MSVATVPFISVIVPAYQAENVLPRSLAALCASSLPRDCWELVVVDDASTDATSSVAARYADVVVRLSGKAHGPAYARNRGSEVCRGEVLVFIDADVAVHTDTLARFAVLFASEEAPAAAFGSYDHDPSSPGIVSQYRNLLHHYVHQRAVGDAETFWAGCGAIRRRLFVEVGMFDEWHYPRPQIEDIELGRRIRRHGHTVLLVPEIQATHLKHWTLRDVVRTDFHSRGVPWMRLILQEGRTPASSALNLNGREKLCTALVGVAVVAGLASILTLSAAPLAIAGISLATVALINRRFYGFLRERRGLALAACAVPLHLLYYFLNGVSATTGWALHHLAGPPGREPPANAESGSGTRMWPPVPVVPDASLWNSRRGGLEAP